jgi:hypothetical protein
VVAKLIYDTDDVGSGFVSSLSMAAKISKRERAASDKQCAYDYAANVLSAV